MSEQEGGVSATVTIPAMVRAESLFATEQDKHHARTSRLFAVLMVAQWAFAILIAFTASPFAWAGRVQTVNAHVFIAVGLGAVLNSLPIALAITRPAWSGTRYVIACAQMLWSALLIHLTGGRIETHFHVFGSLAFLAFYRDWKVLIPATVVVAGDHFIRGMYWPESVFGVSFVEPWRFLEHAGWVVFEDVILVLACLRGVSDVRQMTSRHAEVEELSEREREKSIALDAALTQLKDSQDALVRTEKLAAIGQLAASVGHELRNPLATVRNAATYITKRLSDPKSGTVVDPKVTQFLGLIDRELTVTTRIISDLLDFARERAPMLQPCPLKPLVDEAISVLPESKVQVLNEVPEDLPVPDLDKEQFRQVLINLIQNAIEAIPADRAGEVAVRAIGGEDEAWTLTVTDNGQGMPPETVAKIFEPLYTTKAKGTGLGLAVVSNLVVGHGGTIRVESEQGRGTTFVMVLPARASRRAA